MKNYIICCICIVFLTISGCSVQEKLSEQYIPKLGDSVETVYSNIRGPYFSYDYESNGEIFGYLYLKSENKFSGFGPNMIDEKRDDVQVFLILFKNNLIEDTLILDGNVSDEILDGGGRKLFKNKGL